MIDFDAIKKYLLESEDCYAEARKIAYKIDAIVDEVIDEKYVKIRIITIDGNISDEISEKIGYYVTWIGHANLCGTNIVYVPRSECTKALLSELKQYDPLLGGSSKPLDYPTVD